MELEYGTATLKELPQMVELLGVLFTDEAEFQPDAGKQKRALEALLKHVVATARAEGVLRITLLTDMQNERAQAMYRRVGFVGSPMKPMRLKVRSATGSHKSAEAPSANIAMTRCSSESRSVHEMPSIDYLGLLIPSP